MEEGYLAEIRLWAANFPPRMWAFCEGQTMQIMRNEALFALIGTMYGGDGRTTFQLPDMREKDEKGNSIPMVQTIRNGKPGHIICIQGIFPQRD